MANQALGQAGSLRPHAAVRGQGLAFSPAARSCRSRGSLVVRASQPRVETDPRKRVVITGMGVASCFGNDVDTFYDSLLEGKSGVGTIDRFDASAFPTNFGAQIRNFDNEGLISGKAARRYDDCISYTFVAARKALQQAGIDKEQPGFEGLDKTKTGVLIGSGMGGLTVFQDNVKALLEKGVRKVSPFFIPYAITNMSGALVAIEMGFMGPNYSISTACATANYAFVSAANHIRAGDADVMLAGGCEAPIIPVGLGGFVACRALSTRCDEPERASRPWDKGRDGFVMGEGAGVMVLESLEHAQARGAPIIAEYLGGAVTTDAHHMTDPRPDGLGVSSCIKLALANAGVERERVNYINAHATSTLVGDIAELNAVKSVFAPEQLKRIKINGSKSMIGHALGAAAGLEGVATVKAITTGWVHPTLNQDDIIDEVGELDTVPNVKQQHPVDVAISNSFGFGGHNSVVVFGPYKD